MKRFQTPAERESEGKAKGYGRTLEADLVRGETKLSDLKRDKDGEEDEPLTQQDALVVARGGALGVENSWDREVTGKEDGLALWREFLQERFIQGEDEDFEYGAVDGNDEYDTAARRDEEEAWFDEEEPAWEPAEDEKPASPSRHGETGVQDF